MEQGAICIRQVQKHGVETSARVLPGEHREKHQRPVHEGRLPRWPSSKERRLDDTHQLFSSNNDEDGNPFEPKNFSRWNIFMETRVSFQYILGDGRAQVVENVKIAQQYKQDFRPGGIFHLSRTTTSASANLSEFSSVWFLLSYLAQQ